MADRGFISDDDIQKVRDATDLIQLVGEITPVKQRGKDYWACCPLHHEKTPSFKMDRSTQLWHCFGCGEGGDIFGFIMKTEELTFPEAVRKLAERAHIPIVEANGKAPVASSYKNRLKEICSLTEEFYHLQLMRGKSEAAASARAYLGGRNLGGDIPKDWMLGFAPGNGVLVRYLTSKGFKAKEMIDANVALEGANGKLRDRFYNRIMFPIHDVQGDCIAFGGRIIGKGEPKYLNSQDTPLFHKSNVLFGLDKAKNAMAATGEAIVVEGYTDVIALHHAGVENVVATLGTSLTQPHIRLISRHAKNRIVYLFDGDAAGQKAADRAVQFIDSSLTPEAGRTKVDLHAVTLPDGADPADYIAEHSPEELRALISEAQPLLQYVINRRLGSNDLTKPEGRSKAFTQALTVLAPIKDSVLAKDYAIQIAARCRMREEDALHQLAKLSADRQQPQGELQENELPPRTESRRLSPAELNRLRFERELLCICAQKPELGLQYSDVLASTIWQEEIHSRIAEALLDAFSFDSPLSAAQIINSLQQDIPQSAQILTASLASDIDANAMAEYLAAEIAIGDIEESIAYQRSLLSDPALAGTPEYDSIFESIVAQQKDLSIRRQNKPQLSSK